MDFIKKLFSAISLSLAISIPLTLLEVLMIFNIIDLYEVPFLEKFEYQHILGIYFIIMMTRNKITIKDTNKKEENILTESVKFSINRLFRIVFVWTVALCFHQIFLR